MMTRLESAPLDVISKPKTQVRVISENERWWAAKYIDALPLCSPPSHGRTGHLHLPSANSGVNYPHTLPRARKGTELRTHPMRETRHRTGKTHITEDQAQNWTPDRQALFRK